MMHIPMQLHHQQCVRDGHKHTTLRSQIFPPGTYKMVGKRGVSLGCVDVELFTEHYLESIIIVLNDDGSINWRNQTDIGMQWIARYEGYESVAAFESFMRGFARGMGRRFIEGERNLYLHVVVWVEEREE